jgi:hypothetical protein
MKNPMTPTISLFIVLAAAVATVAFRTAARRPQPRPVPVTEPGPATVTAGESQPQTTATPVRRTPPDTKSPGLQTLRTGQPVSLSRCSVSFTSCTPMSATLFA